MFKAATDILISISLLIENSKLGHGQGPEPKDPLKNLTGDLGKGVKRTHQRLFGVRIKVNPPGRADPANETAHKVGMGTTWSRPGLKTFS